MTASDQVVPTRRPAESFLFLAGPQPTFESQSVKLSNGLVLHKVDRLFLDGLVKKGVTNAAEFAGDCTVCVEFNGTDSPSDLMRPLAFQEALILATDVRSGEFHQVILNTYDGPEIETVIPSPPDLPRRGTILWGHFRSQLSDADIKAAEELMPRVEAFHGAEKFSCVGNALLFYRNGYNSDNPDLALVSFTTCLESLLSTSEQEISFKLSLRVATFLADENEKREELFQAAKEVYRTRSKIVHGAKIHRDQETAAIVLVESMLPQAERLARGCLAKVLRLRIEALFENAEKLNTVFEKLMFSNSLDDALAAAR
ncbi:MAG: hypothetical protein WBE86_09770 [Candidatus Acidiferrales bacterium]